EQGLGNVRKCLEAGYTQVVLLSSEKKQVATLKKSLSETLTIDELGKVLFFLPEEFISYLDNIDVPETPDRKVRDYTVKVKYQALGAEQQQARKQAVADVIVKSMKRMKNT
ncbi:MAG: hypothetical protein ACREA4_10240, partial [Nitrososphaera sp.]